ncbi:MAG: hypothetical protein U0075_18295 [Thermomicrobiales bacterium]
MAVRLLAAINWLPAGEHPPVATVDRIAVRLAQETQAMVGGSQAVIAISEAVSVSQSEAVGVAAGTDEVTRLAVEDRAVVRNLGDEPADSLSTLRGR